jgi:hypothetical protein
MSLSLMRLRKDKSAISNVIVAMLSLILVTIVVSNVILWSYQMNEFDLQTEHEAVRITNVACANTSSWFLAGNEYTVDVGTKVYGTYRDTQSVDGRYESFTEGVNWWNPSYAYRRSISIQNNGGSPLVANYSVQAVLDTASLISSNKIMPDGNDLRVVFWSGSNWIELDREVQYLNTTSTQVWFKTQAVIPANGLNANYYLYYANPSAGSPPANRSNVYLWFDDFNRTDNSDITTEAAYSVKTGGGVWSIENGTLKNVGNTGDPNKLIITALGNVGTGVDMTVKINVVSFAGGDTSRMGLSCSMDTSQPRGSGYCSLFHNDRSSLDLLNDLRSWGSHATYSWSVNTWYYLRFSVADPSSNLGKVKVWPVGVAEPSSWTLEGSFGGGAARGYGEIGFAGSRTTDTTYFDDMIIRTLTTSEPSTSVGIEESQGNLRLEFDGQFNVDLSTYPLYRIKTVEVQMLYRSSDAGDKWYMQAYNWTASAYSYAGFNSTAGQLPTMGWDYYAVNFTNQWNSYINSNGTFNIKVFDYGVDGNKTTIDIDFLATRVVIDGTQFAFENTGSVTSHIVALWVDNSTQHQRYQVSLFINSGETISYFTFNVNLPEEPYTVKIVTERGNLAVYS